MSCGSNYFLYCWFWFFFPGWITGRYTGSFALSGVCGNIFGLLSENIMEGTDCAKFFVAHFKWCILECTYECLQAMEDTIFWCQGGLCSVVIPIFEGVVYLGGFGVFGVNMLALVMF